MRSNKNREKSKHKSSISLIYKKDNTWRFYKIIATRPESRSAPSSPLPNDTETSRERTYSEGNKFEVRATQKLSAQEDLGYGGSGELFLKAWSLKRSTAPKKGVEGEPPKEIVEKKEAVLEPEKRAEKKTETREDALNNARKKYIEKLMTRKGDGK